METKKKVERLMKMLPCFPEQDIYAALEECQMDFGNAIRGLFSQESEKETGENEGEEQKKENNSNNSEKLQVPMVELIMEFFPNWPEQEIHEVLRECEMDVHNAILRLLSQERKEKVERIKENVKETKFTEEDIDKMLKYCSMDDNLATEQLLFLDGFEEVKSKWTKKKERTMSQHKFGSSSRSSVSKQGGRVDVGTGRTGKGKGKEVVRSMGGKTEVRSRSHVSPLRAMGPPRIHSSRARSDPRASRNKGTSSPRNDSRNFPAALGVSATMRKGELRGESSIWGSLSYAELLMPSKPEKWLSPQTHALELLPTSSELRIHAEESETQYEVGSSSIVKQGGNPDDDAGRTDKTHDDAVHDIHGVHTVEIHKEFIPNALSEAGPRNSPDAHSVATMYSSVGADPTMRSMVSEIVGTGDSPSGPSGATPSNSSRCSIQSNSPDLPSSPFHHMYSSMERPAMTSMSGPSGATPSNSPRCSIQYVRNNHRTYSSMGHPSTLSANAPPFTPSASIHQSSQTPLRGNNLWTGHGFTHSYVEPSYCQPQLPLQHAYMNSDEYIHQNLRYDMTSPQQEVYRGGSSSWAHADPSGWGSFPGRGSNPQSHQFRPNSPAPSDSSRTQLNSALHVEAQRQHRNDYCAIGMYYNFPVRNNQLDPGTASALPEQHQGGFPGWVHLPSDVNNQRHDMPSAQQGGFPRWVPLPSDGNNQRHDMSSAQQELNQGGGSSRANASTSGWGSIQGTGSTCSQSPPIPPHSPAPFNISWTSHDSTLEAQDQYRNDHPFLISPGPASTPRGHFPGWVPLPTNGRNQQAIEGSSPQYVYHGLHHPGIHQQQSPYNTSISNLQDLSTMHPPQDQGP